MLVSLTLENWKSFREETTFTMEVLEDTDYSYHVPVSKRLGLKILPITAIFGGNASGKSNLLRLCHSCRTASSRPRKAEAISRPQIRSG